MKMKRIRYIIAFLLVSVLATGCMKRKLPEKVSMLGDKFKLVDVHLAKSGCVVARQPVDASALRTREGYEYRVYDCTSALPSLVQIQVSLSTNGELLVDTCTTPARGSPKQTLKNPSDVTGDVIMDLDKYWMTVDKDYARRHSVFVDSRHDDVSEREASCIWLGKQLEAEDKTLAETEAALHGEESRPQPDESRLRELRREVSNLKISREGIAKRIAEFRKMGGEAEPTTEPYSK